MFWKKNSVLPVAVPKINNLAMADAWSHLMYEYDSLRIQSEGYWNRTHNQGILNFFLDQHRELSERFPSDYGKWENPLVEAAYTNAKEGKPFPPTMKTDLSRLDETEHKAASWNELLNTYCRIRGSLRVEWRPWHDPEYREFLATIDKLRGELGSP